jgi:hypothetical protein
LRKTVKFNYNFNFQIFNFQVWCALMVFRGTDIEIHVLWMCIKICSSYHSLSVRKIRAGSGRKAPEHGSSIPTGNLSYFPMISNWLLPESTGKNLIDFRSEYCFQFWIFPVAVIFDLSRKSLIFPFLWSDSNRHFLSYFHHQYSGRFVLMKCLSSFTFIPFYLIFVEILLRYCLVIYQEKYSITLRLSCLYTVNILADY